MSDDLPSNSESRSLGVVLRNLTRHTDLKFIVTYADPIQGHVGTIHQATNWTYTGLSRSTPLYDLGDGKARHSRSLSHGYGTHSIRHFEKHGVKLRVITQQPKHRYIYFLGPGWRSRLIPVGQPYPNRDQT